MIIKNAAKVDPMQRIRRKKSKTKTRHFIVLTFCLENGGGGKYLNIRCLWLVLGLLVRGLRVACLRVELCACG